MVVFVVVVVVVVRNLEASEYPDKEKHDRAFKLLSKQKSFFLRAKTVDMRRG